MLRSSASSQTRHLAALRRSDGTEITYDPARLKGVDAFKPVSIQIAEGERIQFTAPLRALRIANREQGIIESLSPEGQASIRLDSGRTVSMDLGAMRHLEHGYAVTSHSSQGLTAERVLVHADTAVHAELVSDRFAYVSISRASQEATLYTNDLNRLTELISRSQGKSSASGQPLSLNSHQISTIAPERTLGA